MDENDTESEEYSDDITYIFERLTPVRDSVPELTRLATLGDAEANFRLYEIYSDCLFAPSDFKEIPEDHSEISYSETEFADVSFSAADKYGVSDANQISDQLIHICTGYEEFGHTMADAYKWLVAAIENGKNSAVVDLYYLKPDLVFGQQTTHDLSQRMAFAKEISKHNELVRETLPYVAASGNEAAMLALARMYAIGEIVDPNPFEAAYWLTAYEKLSNKSVSPHFKKSVLNGISEKEYESVHSRTNQLLEIIN